jgi:hypothetical protein
MIASSPTRSAYSDKATGKLQGMWAVYIDWGRKEFLLNVLLAEKFEVTLADWRKRAVPSTRSCLMSTAWRHLVSAFWPAMKRCAESHLARARPDIRHDQTGRQRGRRHPPCPGHARASTTSCASRRAERDEQFIESAKSCASSRVEPQFPDGKAENPAFRFDAGPVPDYESAGSKRSNRRIKR